MLSDLPTPAEASSESEPDEELQTLLRDANMALESDLTLQQTSMYHFTMTQKDEVSVLWFQDSAVHRLYNLLLNFVPKLNLPPHSEPVTIFSPRPFLNCNYNEAQVLQRNVTGDTYVYRVEGLIFQTGLLATAEALASEGTTLSFECEQFSKLMQEESSVTQVRRTQTEGGFVYKITL